jgi:mono/diheme cytochrome c family protein
MFVTRPPRRHRALLLATGLSFVASLATVLAQGQAPAPGKTVWDGVYSEAQAQRGMQPFEQSCANCHAMTATGNRPLVGKDFLDGFMQKSVADLVSYVTVSMPNGRGNSLPAATYHDIVAYMLKANGFPPTSADLSPDTARDVRIAPKDGSTVLPNGALVRVVGCLLPKGGAADWTLANVTAPVRVDKPGADAGDATVALGTGTTPLKFVLTRLDGFVGQRVSVGGFLIGDGGSGGINVSAVTRVSETCP